MRALLLLLPVVLAGCFAPSTSPATQRDILRQSKLEIDRREPWAGSAAIIVQNPDDFYRFSWHVKAGALDRSDPHYSGIHFVPGTQRELRFTTAGCLTHYANTASPCLTPGSTTITEVRVIKEK